MAVPSSSFMQTSCGFGHTTNQTSSSSSSSSSSHTQAYSPLCGIIVCLPSNMALSSLSSQTAVIETISTEFLTLRLLHQPSSTFNLSIRYLKSLSVIPPSHGDLVKVTQGEHAGRRGRLVTKDTNFSLIRFENGKQFTLNNTFLAKYLPRQASSYSFSTERSQAPPIYSNALSSSMNAQSLADQRSYQRQFPTSPSPTTSPGIPMCVCVCVCTHILL